MYNSVIRFECPSETLVRQVRDTVRIFDARYVHELVYDNKILILDSTLYEMGIKDDGIIGVIRVSQGSFDFFAKTVYREIARVIKTADKEFQRLPIKEISNIDDLARHATMATYEAIYDDECLRIAIRESFANDKSKLALSILEKHNFSKLTPEENEYVMDTVARHFTRIRYMIESIITEIKNRDRAPFMRTIPVPPEMLLDGPQKEPKNESKKLPPKMAQKEQSQKAPQRESQKQSQKELRRQESQRHMKRLPEPILEKSQEKPQGPIIALPHLEPHEDFPFEVPTKSKNSK